MAGGKTVKIDSPATEHTIEWYNVFFLDDDVSGLTAGAVK